jgi:hypothetical protein
VVFRPPIDLCGLIILYSTIDSLAWLCRPEHQLKVERRDFLAWANRYLIQVKEHVDRMCHVRDRHLMKVPYLRCSALDLYAARCGLIHSYTAESELAARGEAKRVFYTQGDPSRALAEVNEQERANVTFLNTAELFAVFRQGVQFFKTDLCSDRDLQKRVQARCAQLFSESWCESDSYVPHTAIRIE